MNLAGFAILSVLAVVSALSVILQRNPVMSALSLVVTIFSLAVAFLSLGTAFLAAVQVIVYAGAIMVLFVFVIMLLDLGRREPLRWTGLSRKLLGLAAAAAFFAQVAASISSTGVLGAKPAAPLPPGYGSAADIGRAVFTDYLYPFEAASVLLLAAMVGALVMAKKRIER
jgi:NADH-quinone oxidoreductase subunit J